jgi:hypothetical protein
VVLVAQHYSGIRAWSDFVRPLLSSRHEGTRWTSSFCFRICAPLLVALVHRDDLLLVRLRGVPPFRLRDLRPEEFDLHY